MPTIQVTNAIIRYFCALFCPSPLSLSDAVVWCCGVVRVVRAAWLRHGLTRSPSVPGHPGYGRGARLTASGNMLRMGLVVLMLMLTALTSCGPGGEVFST